MSIGNEKDKRFFANSIFPSFFYAALALVLGQVGAAQMHGSWGLRVFLGAPGLALSGLALFRARLHWPAVNGAMPSFHVRDLGWYIALFAVGVSIGVLVSKGTVMLLGVVAALTYLLPWTRIPVCREQFVVSSLVMLAGAVACGVTRGRPDQALNFMIAAWFMYIAPMCMHFLILASLDRGYRVQESCVTEKSGLDAHVPFPE
jgi:hypothetical protein